MSNDSAQDHQKRESAEEEERISRTLFDSFDQVDALFHLQRAFEVRAGTAFAGDDEANPLEPLSRQFKLCIEVAFDNLRTVATIIRTAGAMPVGAHFGLLRNALEAVGIGLWLIGPESRDERVFRGLQLSYENRRDMHSLNAALSGSDEKLPNTDETVLRLKEIRDLRAGNIGRQLSPTTISRRLGEAQKYTSLDLSILVVWKLTSGIAHGRRDAMIQLLDREVVSLDGSDVNINLRSSFGAVAGVHSITFRYLMRLIRLALGRNGNPTVL